MTIFSELKSKDKSDVMSLIQGYPTIYGSKELHYLLMAEQSLYVPEDTITEIRMVSTACKCHDDSGSCGWCQIYYGDR